VHRRGVGEGALRGDQGTGQVLDQIDPDVHLEHGEAAAFSIKETLPHTLRIGLTRGVGVTPDAIPEPAADQGVRGHAVRLAGEVHQRHLDPADAAALPAVPAELFDLAKDLVQVARVLADDPTLQHQRVRRAGAVSDLAVTDDPLIGLEPDDRRRKRDPDQVRDLEIGDPQFAGPGSGVDVVLAEHGRGACAGHDHSPRC
jgi:hypothetical protein